MGESIEMNDQLTGKLSRLTPTTTGFDRDAVLFAAGRASARPSKAWPATVALLLIAQVVTLSLVLNRPEPQSLTILAKQNDKLPPNNVAMSDPPTIDLKRWIGREAILTGQVGELLSGSQQAIDVNQEPIWTVLSHSSINIE